MGDVCAVKVFADLVRTVHIQIKSRELELMRKLKHRNIVCLLAIEQEVFPYNLLPHRMQSSIYD